ncbi:MAG: hypothetical protein HQL32_18250, partial [Planctomycetes bacterium]|nr:hypothetical protein [Planctomycetota bacterium]
MSENEENETPKPDGTKGSENENAENVEQPQAAEENPENPAANEKNEGTAAPESKSASEPPSVEKGNTAEALEEESQATEEKGNAAEAQQAETQAAEEKGNDTEAQQAETQGTEEKGSKAKATAPKKKSSASKKKPTANSNDSPNLGVGVKDFSNAAPMVLIALLVVVVISFFFQLSAYLFSGPSTLNRRIIDRNALLPHPYAGTCLNCHGITDTPPVNMNAGNMDKFRLTKTERNLLLAGQSVEVPSFWNRLPYAPITREAKLVHKYTGVCSNCHLIYKSPPSAKFMADARQKTRIEFEGRMILQNKKAIARGMTKQDPFLVTWGNFWGFVALLFFIISTVY